MTKRERSSRPDRPSRERFLDALLDLSLPDSGLPDRDTLPDGDPTRWQPVAQVLAALTSAPESSELAGEARALAEFRAFAQFGASAKTPARGAELPPPAPRRMTWLPGGRLAMAAATGAVLVGGLLAVAYAGDLPGPAQRLAHTTIDAPAARPDRDPAVSSQLTGSPNSPGRAGQQGTHALVGPDREVPSGYASGPASATPSPSAALSPSQSAPLYPRQSPSSPQSTPP